MPVCCISDNERAKARKFYNGNEKDKKKQMCNIHLIIPF
jgi:hypothetical protein